jgi:cell wall-associated NlpC family hydrolase
MSGSIVGSYKKGTKVTCYGTSGSWTKVKYNGNYRYIHTSYLSSKAVSTSSGTAASAVTGTDVVNYAMQFVGNPYKYGGSSLTNGADCSGFTMAVYAHFGYSLPHYSVSQRSSGVAVSSADRKPGDLICYNESGGSSHVAIYIGNNQVVHAGSTSTGIHVSTWNYRSVNCVRRIIK